MTTRVFLVSLAVLLGAGCSPRPEPARRAASAGAAAAAPQRRAAGEPRRDLSGLAAVRERVAHRFVAAGGAAVAGDAAYEVSVAPAGVAFTAAVAGRPTLRLGAPRVLAGAGPLAPGRGEVVLRATSPPGRSRPGSRRGSRRGAARRS
ncbi:MAG TPA: hypothetical protein VGQ83_29695 [Polyangia bacterium]|jgi:hypothetical protein